MNAINRGHSQSPRITPPPYKLPALKAPALRWPPSSSAVPLPSPDNSTHLCRRLLGKEMPALSRGDWFGVFLGISLVFAITLINGHGRIFWEDETLGWMLLRDPSWAHMLRAWRLGADGGGIFFYIFGRAWFHLFGDSVTAFRLFTATGFGLSLALLWTALRRFYSVGVVAFAVFNTLFFSPPLTMHYMEGRFYGLLMLGTVLAFSLGLALDAVPDPVPSRWYSFLFGAHLLLTGSHVLGIAYSAFLLMGMVVLDCLRGRRRLSLYLTACSSWLLLVFERTAMRATAAVGKPHFWTKAPSLGQLIGAWTVFSPEVFLVLLVLVLSVVAMLPGRPQQLRQLCRTNVEQRLALYCMGGALLLVPLGFLLEGLTGVWLFTDRYLQPVAIGVSCLTAELCWSLRRSSPLTDLKQSRPAAYSALKCSLVLVCAAALLFWVFRHEAAYTPSVPDFTDRLTERLPPGIPVVVEDAFTFTDLMSRPAANQRAYTYLLNWQYALSSEAQRAEVTQYHLMQNWKLAGYFSSRIQEESEFLRENERFLIVSNSILGVSPSERPETGNPVAKRLALSSDYCVQQLSVLDRTYHDRQRDTVWLVQRGGCSSPQPLK